MKRFIIPLLVMGVSIGALTAQARTPLYIEAEAETGVACTMQYQPVCGAKEVQCIKAPCYPVYQTYGNSCVLGAAKATFVHEGECTAADAGPLKGRETYTPPAHCIAWFDGCNQCGRDENGMAFCTEKACVDAPAAGYCTKYADQPAPKPEPTPLPASSTTSTTTSEANVSVETPGFFTSLWLKFVSFFDFF